MKQHSRCCALRNCLSLSQIAEQSNDFIQLLFVLVLECMSTIVWKFVFCHFYFIAVFHHPAHIAFFLSKCINVHHILSLLVCTLKVLFVRKKMMSHS